MGEPCVRHRESRKKVQTSSQDVLLGFYILIGLRILVRRRRRVFRDARTVRNEALPSHRKRIDEEELHNIVVRARQRGNRSKKRVPKRW